MIDAARQIIFHCACLAWEEYAMNRVRLMASISLLLLFAAPSFPQARKQAVHARSCGG